MANSLSCGDIFHSIQRDGSQRHSIGSLFQMLKPAIWVLLDKGVEAVLVTLGSEGVFLCSKGGSRCMKLGSKKISPGGLSEPLYKLVTSTCPSNHRLFSSMKSEESSHFLAVHFPALRTSVVRLTGAGDCLVGGTIASICAGLDVFRSVAVGIAAAKGAVESERNVPAEFSLSKLADDASKVYAAAKVLFHQSML